MAEPHSITGNFDPREPYRAAWKEFDDLEDWAVTKWAIFAALGLVAAIAEDFLRNDPKFKYALWGVVIGVGLINALIDRRGRSRWDHWLCPRCRSEWPGKKSKKAAACATCGLRLHQMSP
jgi:hypothetical protein